MKPSNLPRKVWRFMCQGTPRQHFAVIYLFALLVTCVLFMFFEPASNIDTQSYFEAGEALALGQIDDFRTPVFPLVCKFATMICAPEPFMVVVMINVAVMWVSVFFLYRLCSLLIQSRLIIFLVTLLYACTPDFFIYAMTVLTESLSLSFLVVFCYTVLQGAITGSKRYAIVNLFLLLLLVFLRPIFIFLAPIVLLLWICLAIVRRHNWSTIILNFATLLLFCGIYFGYCKAVQRTIGAFSPSIVTQLNQYVIMRNEGYIDPSVIQDRQMREDVISLMAHYDSLRSDPEHYIESSVIRIRYGVPAFTKYVQDNIKAHFAEHAAHTAKRFVSVMRLPSMHVPLSIFKSPLLERIVIFLNNYFVCAFRTVYLLLLVSGIVFCGLGVRQRRLPFCSMFLWLIVAANVACAVIGAQAEYARLAVPCMPMLLIITAMLCDMVVVRVKKNHVVP